MTRPAPHFVVVANPAGRRLALFQQALAGLGHPPACVVPWIDLLAGRAALEAVVRRGSVVRIESPGQDFPVEKALLAAGADVPDEPGPTRLSRAAVARVAFDKGRILAPRQWYLGFRSALASVERRLAASPPHAVMNHPADVAAMFDKPRCQALLAAAGVPVPAPLGVVRSYEELRGRLTEAGRRRVFIKLAHGSSASGVVAYQTDGVRELAITSVELVGAGGDVRLYNSRRIRRYERHEDVVRLIDALAREGVQVEQWVPKAGAGGLAFDLRVLVIAGRPRHTVVRLSRSPLTNLHLKNQRGDVAAVRECMGEEAWAETREICARAAGLFPRSLYAGIDLAIAPGFRRHAVLEVNAFGDLLPGITDGGEDSYTAEVCAHRDGYAGCDDRAASG
jgi:hypothetical protein